MNNTIQLTAQNVKTLIVVAVLGLIMAILSYVMFFTHSTMLPWMAFGHFGLMLFFGLIAYAKPKARVNELFCLLFVFALIFFIGEFIKALPHLS